MNSCRYPGTCKPGPVTEVVSVQVSGQYLQRQVTWTPPASPPIPISSYTVLCSTDTSSDGNRTISTNGTQVSAIVGAGAEGPLTQGSVYVCSVIPFNDAGEGPSEGSPSFVTYVILTAWLSLY